MKTNVCNAAQFRRSCFALALAVFSSAASAGLVTVASDDFEGYGVGALAGHTGGTGWTGAWATSTPVVVQVVDPSPDLQGDLAISFAGANNASAASRAFSPMLSGDVFVDFLIRFTGVVNDNDFLALWFGSSSGPNIGLKANCGGGACPGGTDLFVRTNGTGGSFLTGSNLTVGATYQIFGHLYKSGNANYNRFDAWLDPTALEMATLANPDASFAGTSSISSFNTIGFRTDGIDAGDAILIDRLRVQTVAEPGSLALAGLALAGLAGIRRRRSA